MEITVVHISYACTGDENQVSLLIASAKQRFSLCESADRCADNHLYARVGYIGPGAVVNVPVVGVDLRSTSRT